eukprot:79925-Amphidinium_carterae.1
MVPLLARICSEENGLDMIPFAALLCCSRRCASVRLALCAVGCALLTMCILFLLVALRSAWSTLVLGSLSCNETFVCGRLAVCTPCLGGACMFVLDYLA